VNNSKPECKVELKEFKKVIDSNFSSHMNYVTIEVIQDLLGIRIGIINEGSLYSQKVIDDHIGLRLTELLMRTPFLAEHKRSLSQIKNELSTRPLISDKYNNLDLINKLNFLGV
jgi:hypothetical protein